MFMKRWVTTSSFIFVVDVKHVPTSQLLLDEFLEKYPRNFELTRGKHLPLMESFIGLEVEQSRSKISLHLDNYIRDSGPGDY